MDFLYSRHRLNVANVRRSWPCLRRLAEPVRVRARTPDGSAPRRAFCRFEEMARASPARAGAIAGFGSDPGQPLAGISSRATARQDAGARLDVIERDVLARAVRDLDVTPPMTHGVAPTLTKRLVCPPVRLGEERRAAASDGLDGRRQPDRQRVVGRRQRAIRNRPPVISISSRWVGSAAHAAAMAARSAPASASAAGWPRRTP